MKKPIKSKKDAISDLEYVLIHLTFYTKDVIAHAQRDNIYNVLMFYFGVSKKRLDNLMINGCILKL